jgi:hypothetical protein
MKRHLNCLKIVTVNCYSRLITGFVNRLTGRVSQVEQELLPFPDHPGFE